MLDSTPSPTPTPQLTPTPTIPPTIAPAADTEPPSVPANARAISRTDTAFTFAWDASTDNVGVAGYTIDRGASLIQTTIATTATLGGLTASTIYTVTVTAHDAAGNVSPASAAITITTNPAISAFADLYEPDNSFDQARPIATGETQHHAFSVSADQDWVAFSAIAGKTYQIETNNLAPNVNTYLELYDRDGTTLLAEDDDSNGDFGSWIGQPINISGAYYVKARNISSASGGPSYAYDLRVTLADREAPSAPSNLRSTGKTNTTVNLAWDAATDNIELIFRVNICSENGIPWYTRPHDRTHFDPRTGR